MWMIALTCAGSTLSPGPEMIGRSYYPNGLDLGSSTELITLRPWCTGKQLPLGLSVFDHGSGRRLTAVNRDPVKCGVASRYTMAKLQAASNKQLLLLVHYHKRQAIYPAPSPTTVQGYRILKDLSRKLFLLIHKKRFDKDPDIG